MAQSPLKPLKNFKLSYRHDDSPNNNSSSMIVTTNWPQFQYVLSVEGEGPGGEVRKGRAIVQSRRKQKFRFISIFLSKLPVPSCLWYFKYLSLSPFYIYLYMISSSLSLLPAYAKQNANNNSCLFVVTSQTMSHCSSRFPSLSLYLCTVW